MIRGLVEQKLTIDGVEYKYPDTTAIVAKINELTDAVNSLRDDCNLLMGYIAPEYGTKPTMAKNASVAENCKCAKNAQEAKKNHKICSTNERLREALSLAENALIRLANNAYDMDQHIYIDAILSRIDKITKGGK